jgi:DNA-binding winged helix-turn-helix (wHTH) protein
MEKEELMQRLWPETFVEETNLSNNISLLRKALGDDAGEHRYIETVPRRGYRFVAEVAELSGEPTELIVEERTRVTLEQEEELDASTASCGSPIADSRHIGPTSNASGVQTALALQEPSTISKRGRVAVVASFVVVLAAVAAFFAWSKRPRNEPQKSVAPPPFQRMEIKRVTASGKAKGAAISPDGRYITYSSLLSCDRCASATQSSGHRRRTSGYPIAPAQILACGSIAPGSSEILASASGFKPSKHSAYVAHAAKHQHWSSTAAYP